MVKDLSLIRLNSKEQLAKATSTTKPIVSAVLTTSSFS